MKKVQYIAPTLCVTTVGLENMIALSGPRTSTTAASQEAGMDVKVERQDYNVWDDDWSK